MKTMLWAVPALLLGANLAQAKNRAPQSENRPVVIAVDPAMNVAPLEGGRYQTFSEAKEPPSEIPEPSERDRLLADAGLGDRELSGFDELAKDLLVHKALHHTLDELGRQYPGLPREALAAMQKALLARK